MSSALLIIERNEQILSLLYREHRLVQVKVHEKDPDFAVKTSVFVEPKEPEEKNISGNKNSSLRLGAVYIGKVKNVVPVIDAAFVEIQKEKMGFLPLKNAKSPIIVNRKYDGRIVAGDEILVQIEKEGIKTKDPGLTCNLSFTGKYCVLTTGKEQIGFSSKLDKNTKNFWKEKLKNWNLNEILHSENMGMVVRTNIERLMEVSDSSSYKQEELSETQNIPQHEQIFKEEFDRLLKLKNKVLREVSYRTCFSCLFQPMEGYLTDIRDTYENSFDKIITNHPDIYTRIREEFPTLEMVEFYQDSQISLEKLYSTETRLQEALEEKVWLKSGAYLIIQQTEALTVIDVNSGKIQKKHPTDDIYFEINKEAAKEIALQLRLRNLSGIIIIDFISQNKKEQDTQLLAFLDGLVKQDSVKTNVVDMTPLGLVEVTRKKVNKSLKEQLRRK